jgi:hypothetical protein
MYSRIEEYVFIYRMKKSKKLKALPSFRKLLTAIPKVVKFHQA